MRLPTIFKQNQNKSFDYTPRYYDERKERLEKLYKKHHGDKPAESKETFVRRETFRDSWYRRKHEKTNRSARIRTMLIAGSLVAIVYKLYKYFGLSF
jgi:hypothetical protein